MKYLSLVILSVLVSYFCEASIYEDLWKIDQKENGLSVSNMESNQATEIVIDEQKPYRKDKRDAAPKPLFHQVKSPKLGHETYRKLEKLFDNYEFSSVKEEDALGANPIEDVEREQFLEAVLKTNVMLEARKHLGFTEKKMKEELTRLWFEPFTNYFGGNESPFCTGFEHIFLGEESRTTGFGGYHYWFKFWLEEKAGVANYFGFNYLGVPRGEEEPYVSTIAMKWLINKRSIVRDVTGFLVGPSPELVLAWGTLAYFDNVKFSPVKGTEIPVEVENSKVSLVLHRETKKKGGMGDHIRTFYPKLVDVR